MTIFFATAAIPARAEPFAGEDLPRPPIEWSTWARVGYGIAVAPHARSIEARAIDPIDPIALDRDGQFDAGLGIEASLALSMHGDVRLGGWLESRGLARDDQFAGGELVITRVPKRLDMFLYEGHGILALRVGRSTTAETASLAYGYLAPWKLEGECRVRFYEIETGVCSPRAPSTTRYMIGVRLVATVTRQLQDDRAWAATLGIEFEPIGAARAMFALRSLY